MPKEKKEDEKKLLDLTTDEAMEFLFPKEVVDHLKEVAKGKNPPPTNGDEREPEIEEPST